MEVKTRLNHLRMSARKIRLVIDLIRKLPVANALDQLKFMNKLAAEPVTKLIESGVASAVNTYSLEADNLFIKEIRADEGVTLKRWMPRAHGRATSIRKRGCHVSLTLGEIKASAPKAKKTMSVAEPVKLEKLARDSEKATGKTGAKTDKERGRQAAGSKTRMFRRKAG